MLLIYGVELAAKCSPRGRLDQLSYAVMNVAGFWGGGAVGACPGSSGAAYASLPGNMSCFKFRGMDAGSLMLKVRRPSKSLLEKRLR